jgi:hypothetical protein
MASFPQASPPTPCAHLCPPPYLPHAQKFVALLCHIPEDNGYHGETGDERRLKLQKKFDIDKYYQTPK